MPRKKNHCWIRAKKENYNLIEKEEKNVFQIEESCTCYEKMKRRLRE